MTLINHYCICRYRLSDRCTAAVATAVLRDLGLVTEENDLAIIDRSKVRRERERVGTNEVNQRLPDVTELTCIGFDSRNDQKVSSFF